MLAHSVNLSGGDFMSKVVNGRIILDKEESKNLLKDIFHPDVEALKKRDAFIEGTKNWTIQRLGNGRTIIDIPDLKLPSPHTSPSRSDISNEFFVAYSEQSFSDISLDLPVSPISSQYNNISFSNMTALSTTYCVVFFSPILAKEASPVSLPTFPQFGKTENL